MGQLLLLLLGLVVIFLLLVIVLGRVTIRLIERAVPKRPLEAEFVLGTGLAPGDWTRRYHKIMKWLESRGASQKTLSRFEKFSKRRVVRRLRRLGSHFQRAGMFEDEADRVAMTRQIRDIGRRWEQSTWTEFAPPGVGAS